MKEGRAEDEPKRAQVAYLNLIAELYIPSLWYFEFIDCKEPDTRARARVNAQFHTSAHTHIHIFTQAHTFTQVSGACSSRRSSLPSKKAPPRKACWGCPLLSGAWPSSFIAGSTPPTS